MFDLKNEVKAAFIENKTAIIASASILFISIILGYVFEPYLYSILNPVVEDMTNKVQSGVIKLTFEDVFINNIIIVLEMFIFGIFCNPCSSYILFIKSVWQILHSGISSNKGFVDIIPS